ncbi:uncharacterized protein LOC101858929 [Aplysia californica]|uniref:Uncharacterized protein LOC101858929 n=1 Tax=Aplysia californica TaxID=6500 RepID=A0ABM0ZXD9_APLCA|nr:uncharacterized protein LOC101858929 [Aplysia californica]
MMTSQSRRALYVGGAMLSCFLLTTVYLRDNNNSPNTAWTVTALTEPSLPAVSPPAVVQESAVWLGKRHSHSFRAGDPESTARPKLQHLLDDDFSYCRRQAPFVGPIKFTKTLKNPCWWEGETLRCLPFFYVAGFSKSGTTDLISRMNSHPEVKVIKKEKHWLDYFRYMDTFRFISNYTDMFQPVTDMFIQMLKENTTLPIVTGRLNLQWWGIGCNRTK